MHRTLTGTIALALGLALLATAAHADESLNQRVVQFAADHLGKKVGDGECATLIVEALRTAGAAAPVGDSEGRFTFGKPIERKALTAGDLIHFEKARFEHKSADGGFSWAEFPLHTAIVQRVQGTRVTLLHQNYGGKRTVQRLTLDLADLKRGTVAYSRPQPR
ncbi:MAG TPA: hypothetical protein VEL76_21985 [Gemmataceae bacterium]|nr:hypothetical protein [Gemmataceae bacterium]